jgi:hypothetical protein
LVYRGTEAIADHVAAFLRSRDEVSTSPHGFDRPSIGGIGPGFYWRSVGNLSK